MIGPDNQPLSGIEVRAQAEGSSTSVRTERDGSFTFVATQPGSYQLSVDLGGCRLYWNAGNPSWTEEQAETIEVVNRDITNIRLRVEEDPCTRLTGWFLDAAGDAVANVQINAVADDHRAHARTDSSGRFSIALVEPGTYRLDTWLDGCRLYYGRSGATGVWQERQTVDVTEHDVSGLVFQLEPHMCALRISGTLLNADGSPGTGIWVEASGESGRGGDWPASDGTFSFAVPGAGVYDMRVTVDGCEIYYAGNGKTGAKDDSHLFVLTRSDVTGVEFRLPEDPVSICN